MKNKYIFVLTMLSVILIGSLGLTNYYVARQQQEEEANFSVVTSFYPMYIAALNVIGETEGVKLTNLSEPQTGCLHDFQLTPGDMKLLSKADAFVIHGGGIESFMEEVAESYPKLLVVEASSDVDLLEAGTTKPHAEEEALEESKEGHVHTSSEEHHHDHNAHAWMSVANYRIMVATIAEELALADPKNAEEYIINAAIYDESLQDLQEAQSELFQVTEGANVILLHEAYAYVADEFGFNLCYEMNLDEEQQPSAGEIREMLSMIESDGVEYILAEELYGKGMGDTIEEEHGVEVIYLDTLNRGEYEKDSYIKGMQENIELLKQVFIK